MPQGAAGAVVELRAVGVDAVGVGFDDGDEAPPAMAPVVEDDLEVDEFVAQRAGNGKGPGEVREGDEPLTAVGQVRNARADQLRRSTTRTRRSLSVQMICATSQKSCVRTISLGVSFCQASTPPR